MVLLLEDYLIKFCMLFLVLLPFIALFPKVTSKNNKLYGMRYYNLMNLEQFFAAEQRAKPQSKKLVLFLAMHTQ